MAQYSPIPIPLKQRIHLFRLKVVPVLAFLLAVAGVIYLWDREITPSALVGEVHGASSEITAPVAGILEGMELEPFSRVEAGQLLGYLRTTAPESVEAALDVIRAEIELTRLGSFDLVLDQQRNVIDWLMLQQDLLDARSELLSLRIEREQAEREYHRYRNLSLSQHVPASELDRQRAIYEGLVAEEEGMAQRVEALEDAHEAAGVSGSHGIAGLPESLRATIAWQEKQLTEIEAEFAPMPIRAPTAGVVVRMMRSPGEYVVPGTILAVVRSERPDYIIGYLRPPAAGNPQPGMEVEIIPRSDRGARARSEIIAVGTQFEPLGLVFHGPLSGLEERGLPMKIRIPRGLPVKPGELVDLQLLAPRS